MVSRTQNLHVINLLDRDGRLDLLHNGTNAPTVDKPGSGLVSVRRAIDTFMVHSRAVRLTPKTLGFYHTQLSPFLQFCQTHRCDTLRDITPALIRAYLISLEERGLSDYSVHGAARAIRAFLNFCVREEYISFSPMVKVAMPRVNKRILPAFSEDEVHRLLAVCQTERDKAIILVLLDTGCRLSELVNLNGSHIDLQSGEVQIRQGKGRKDRVVFIGHNAKNSLLCYYRQRGTPGGQEAVWLSLTRGTRLTVTGVQQMLRRLGKEANVKHCSPHTFRRTFAIWSLRNGMDIFRLARLMGHSDISVLRQYLYLLKEDLRDAHAQFGSVDKLLQG